MEITLTVNVTSKSDLLKLQNFIKGVDDEILDAGQTVAAAPTTTTKKRAAKVTAPEETFDLDETDTLETADDEEIADEETETEYTVKDVIHALGTYAKKHGQEKAVKILGKYGVKNVQKLDAKHYAAVIAATSK